MAKLDKWSVVDRVISLSFQQLEPGKHLMGNVLSGSSQAKPKLVYTSPIVNVDESRGLVETRNSVYQLGEPSDEYKNWIQQRQTAA